MTKRDSTHERRPRGWYPTPRAGFDPLVPYLPREAMVVEPCAGDGTMCHYLADAGMHVMAAFDIAPQHPMITQRNVLDLDRSAINFYRGAPRPIFVTNPPWPEPRRKGEPTLSILHHLRNLAPTWLLLPADFMHNVYAVEPMRYCHKVVSVGRLKWIPGTDSAGFDNCAWYLFTSEPALMLSFVGNAGARP